MHNGNRRIVTKSPPSPYPEGHLPQHKAYIKLGACFMMKIANFKGNVLARSLELLGNFQKVG